MPPKLDVKVWAPMKNEQLDQLQAEINAYRAIARNEKIDSLLRARMSGSVPTDTSAPKHPPLAPAPRICVLTLNDLKQERERCMQLARTRRLEYLESLAKSSLTRTQRSALTLEVRALRLLQMQAKVRVAVLQHHTAEPEPVTRQKLLEQKRERQRRAEFLCAVVQHAKDFRDFHRGVRRDIGRLARGVQAAQLAGLRDKEKEGERKQRERLVALVNGWNEPSQC